MHRFGSASWKCSGVAPVNKVTRMDKWLLVFSVFGYGDDVDQALQWALERIASSADPALVLNDDIEFERAPRVSAERALSDLLLPYMECGEA